MWALYFAEHNGRLYNTAIITQNLKVSRLQGFKFPSIDMYFCIKSPEFQIFKFKSCSAFMNVKLNMSDSPC